jgi:hypothetical protein
MNKSNMQTVHHANVLSFQVTTIIYQIVFDTVDSIGDSITTLAIDHQSYCSVVIESPIEFPSNEGIFV